jgi:hypothetical protein
VSNATITFTATDVAPTVTNDAFTVTLTSGFGVQTINCTMTVVSSGETGTPPVLLSAVSPSSGAVSTPTAITLTGTGFTSGASVTVNGVSATSVVFVNSTTITCTTPSLAAGVYDVTVTQTSGISTRPAAFTSGAVLIAAFKASVDITGTSATVGTNFSAVKNGVTLTYKSACAAWPVAHPTNPGVSYEGGSHVFRINYAAKAAGEVRFSGLPDVTDLYIEQHIYMPDGTESPYVGDVLTVTTDGSTDNDKLFRLYGVYTSATADWSVLYGASTWPATSPGPGYIGTEYLRTTSIDPYAYNGTGEQGSFYGSNNRQPTGGFLGAAVYAGVWTRLRIRAKVASAANNDGILQIWVNDDLVIQRTNMPTYAGLNGPGVNNFFRSGYLWGFQNNAARANGRLYIDNIRFSTGGFA